MPASLPSGSSPAPGRMAGNPRRDGACAASCATTTASCRIPAAGWTGSWTCRPKWTVRDTSKPLCLRVTGSSSASGTSTRERKTLRPLPRLRVSNATSSTRRVLTVILPATSGSWPMESSTACWTVCCSTAGSARPRHGPRIWKRNSPGWQVTTSARGCRLLWDMSSRTLRRPHASSETGVPPSMTWS